MRDPNETSTALLNFLNDEDAETNYLQLIEAIDKISAPSSDLINPTLDTATNTRLLTLLCEELISMDTIIADHAVTETIRGLAEIQKYGKIHDRAVYQGGNATNSSKLQALYHIAETTHAKSKLWAQYGNLVNAAKDEADTILKVARSLLEVQEKYGKDIRKNVEALGKLTVSIKIIDSRWPALKQRYAEMQPVMTVIEKLEKKRAILQFQVVGKNGKKRVVNSDISALPEGFMSEDEDRVQEVEDSEDERTEIDLDVESSEENDAGGDHGTHEGFPTGDISTESEVGENGEGSQVEANV